MRTANDQDAVETFERCIIEAVETLNIFNKVLINTTRRDTRHDGVYDITQIIQDSFVMFQDLLVAKPIRFQMNLSINPAFVVGNRFHLEQLFKNVILNVIDSIKDAEDNLLRVTVEQTEDLMWVETTIEDTGFGVPEDPPENIFESYFTGKPEGTGLGLAVVKKTVAEHRGKIQVEGEVGKWTKLRILLPASSHASTEQRNESRSAM
jgi:signal transduction histidine kinase